MDGILSQDEINALLNGMDNTEQSGTTGSDASGAGMASTETLTEEERDAVGEIANISMGTSATTLYSLVNRKVQITTPTVTVSNWENLIDEYKKPCVFIQIKYTSGLTGSNILILKEHDVKVITDLMMGGDGTNTEGELGELHLSAISEAMNQMMGSSATSLSSMMGKTIDISPPEATLVTLTDYQDNTFATPFLRKDFAKIEFRMQIEDLVDSTILQLYPMDFAKTIYETFVAKQTVQSVQQEAEPEPYIPPKVEPQQAIPQPQQLPPTNAMPQPMMQGYPQMGMAGYGYPPMGQGYPMGMPQPANINVQNAQFQTFSNEVNPMTNQENIGLIMDVPLEVTVELGRTTKAISDILEFSPGTIIELDKIAGEPVDVLVNGKFVAKGEVVVIEESFGIRVTEIIK